MNVQAATAPVPASPLATRLAQLAPLSASELHVLRAAERDQRRSPPRREIIGEGEPIREQRAILSGWACRQRLLGDGRRQILSYLLPGDLIGICRHERPLAATSILTITEVMTCPAPRAGPPDSGLSRAYAQSAAIEEYHFLAQITRLGRLDAVERIADWLLETHDRLTLAGLCGADKFPMPLTQEMLADTLGLTSVHVNRTLQAMRRDGLVILGGRFITLPDRGQLERLVDYRPVKVSATQG